MDVPSVLQVAFGSRTYHDEEVATRHSTEIMVFQNNLETVRAQKNANCDAEQKKWRAPFALKSNSSLTRKSTSVCQTTGELKLKLALHKHVDERS